MKAIIKETEEHSIRFWVCELDGKEFCRSMSEQGLIMMILNRVRRN